MHSKIRKMKFSLHMSYVHIWWTEWTNIIKHTCDELALDMFVSLLYLLSVSIWAGGNHENCKCSMECSKWTLPLHTLIFMLYVSLCLCYCAEIDLVYQDFICIAGPQTRFCSPKAGCSCLLTTMTSDPLIILEKSVKGLGLLCRTLICGYSVGHNEDCYLSGFWWNYGDRCAV